MSDIFEEVDEAVLHDNTARRWKQFSPFLFVAVAALILGVAGYEFWQAQKIRNQASSADAFYTAQQALEKNDYALAEALFSEIASSDSPFSELSGHYLAQVRLSALGDKAAAIEALKAASEGEGPVAETARLKAGYLIAEESQLADLQIWLEPLLSNPTSPYTYLAQELIASRAYALGNLDESRRGFTAISLSLDAPEGVRVRAERSLAALDAIKAKNGSST